MKDSPETGKAYRHIVSARSLLVAAQGSVLGEVISDCCTGTSNSAHTQK